VLVKIKSLLKLKTNPCAALPTGREVKRRVVMSDTTNYDKLKPFTAIEYCECPQVTELLLVYMHVDNPIYCYQCKKDVNVERLELAQSEVDELASCFSTYGSLYALWMDSGEYEDWAKTKLLDRHGQVNKAGVAIAKSLSQKIPTYYWWFHDADDADPVNCPNCDTALNTDVPNGFGKCERCCVAI
jgi:hypothetical protein